MSFVKVSTGIPNPTAAISATVSMAPRMRPPHVFMTCGQLGNAFGTTCGALSDLTSVSFGGSPIRQNCPRRAGPARGRAAVSGRRSAVSARPAEGGVQYESPFGVGIGRTFGERFVGTDVLIEGCAVVPR